MKLEAYEKETTITFNESDKTAVVYTRMRRVWTHMDKHFEDKKDERTNYSKTYIIPKDRIKLPRRKKTRKPLTNKQKKELTARLIKSRDGGRKKKESKEDKKNMKVGQKKG